MEKSKSKGVNKLDKSITDVNEVNKIIVKNTTEEEPLVMNNSRIKVIKAPDYFKLFKCSKTFFNNLDMMYKGACKENVKGKYWKGFYDTIIKYNDKHYTTLSNVRIRGSINQVMREEEAKPNNLTVDTLSP